jgi:hypothetical protein
MRTTLVRIAVTGALLTACSTDSTGPGAEALLNTDVAAVSADAAATDVELMRGPGGGPFGLGLLARQGSFECGTEGRPQLTVTRTCTYKDAAGATQSAYSALTTASVIMHAEVKGDVTREKWSATVNRVRDLTVTGLAGSETEMTWNGTGTGTSSRVRLAADGSTRSYTIAAKGTIANVVIPVPRTETSWPKSGTITKQVTVKKADGTTVDRTVTIVFNGTQFAKVTVNGETFDFDLSQRGRPKRP